MAEERIQAYPLPRFHFLVKWGGASFSFSEVTGMVIEREKIEFRHSDSRDLNRIAMPGLIKNNNITFKHGKCEHEVVFNEWFNSTTNDRTGQRQNVLISLLNEHHDPVAAWSATRCFLVKITAPDLKSDANEIAIQTLEIAHEGLNKVDTSATGGAR